MVNTGSYSMLMRHRHASCQTKKMRAGRRGFERFVFVIAVFIGTCHRTNPYALPIFRHLFFALKISGRERWGVNLFSCFFKRIQ
jgi:hypothetical protein